MTNSSGMTLKDQVYATVMHGLIDGLYNVESVLSEKKLSEQMKVSKAPVREAMIELCAQGVLKSVPRQGYVVVRYTMRDLKEILQYRMLLECGCLQESFDRITPVQLRHLEGIVEAEFLFHSMHDVKDFWNRTTNFHLTLNSFAENEFLYGRLSSAINTCMRAYLQLQLNKLHDDLPGPPMLHREIVESIRAHDKERAIATLRRDICTLVTPEER